MPRKFSDEQITQARSISLLSFFQQASPTRLKHQGGGRYVHKDHDSFVISNGKDNKWFWNSKGVGGVSALDYLMKIEGMDFVNAVKSLTGEITPTSSHSETKLQPTVKHTPPKQFTLPAPAQSNDNVVAYLQKRGISNATIRNCINKGILYESANNRCIFVGKDAQGKPRFAAERGTKCDTKKDVAGSDKRFGFCIPPETTQGKTNVYVFESAIDALAHHEIEKLNGSNADGYRLSLSGVSPSALFHFLEQNPQIGSVFLCLDSDSAGREATERIANALDGKKITRTLAPIGKDYGETLQAIQTKEAVNTPKKAIKFNTERT
jgi:DNA primase